MFALEAHENISSYRTTFDPNLARKLGRVKRDKDSAAQSRHMQGNMLRSTSLQIVTALEYTENSDYDSYQQCTSKVGAWGTVIHCNNNSTWNVRFEVLFANYAHISSNIGLQLR